LLAQAFGKERVLGALADTSGELLADGTVLFTRNVNILLGELSGGDSPRAQRLARTLDTSGVRAAATREILTLEWSKFCAWAGLMALSVTTRALTWKYLLDPDCALVLARLVREMGVLARTLGIGLSDRSILPVASMCAGPEGEAVAAILKTGREFRANAPDHRMSSLQDLEAGRPLEVNETLGYASAKAANSHSRCPARRFLHCSSPVLTVRGATRWPRSGLGAAREPAILQQRGDLGRAPVEVAKQHLRVLAAPAGQHLRAQVIAVRARKSPVGVEPLTGVTGQHLAPQVGVVAAE